MAKKVERWLSDDGHEYDTELEAIKADAKYWKTKAINYEGGIYPANEHRLSSYGSSGGGHD